MKKGNSFYFELKAFNSFSFLAQNEFKKNMLARETNIQRTRQEIYVVLNKHSKDWINIKFSVSLELRLNCFSVMSELFLLFSWALIC